MPGILRLVALLAALAVLTACGSDEPDDISVADQSDEQSDDGDDTGNDDENEDNEDSGNGSDDGDDGSEDDADDSDEAEQLSEDDVAEEERQLAVFAVRDVSGELWVESDLRSVPASVKAVATAAMEELFGVAPEDPNLTAPAGTDVEVLAVELDDGILTVDVSDDIADAATGAAGEEAFAQALAHTATQFETVDAVRLLVEGEEITELWGHLDWSEPVEADPYARAPVDVDRPSYGETWPPGPITVVGTSVTFESTVDLELIDPDGNVVEEAFTTANQPDVGQRGPFEHTFDTEADEPGTWTIRVREPDPSDGEGRPPYEAEIELQIE